MNWLLSLVFSLAVVAPNSGDFCPVCKSIMTKELGSSKEVNGQRFYKNVCSNQHEVWVEDEFYRSKEADERIKTSTNIDCGCPVCGWHGYITGTIGLKKCTKGHEFKCD